MGLYRVTGPTAVLDNEHGSVFEHDFTAAEEADLLDRGRLALEPRPYRVVGDRDFVTSDGKAHAPGETFDGTFTVGQEQALLQAEHLERAARKPARKPKKEQ